jgi:hypothetical protein
VADISVDNGTVTVTNMVSGSNAKEAILIEQTDSAGYLVGRLRTFMVEDQFDLSMEYNIVIKWAVANLTCQLAKQKETTYACRSSDSDCLNVTHGEIFMGYRCKCLSGFQGNPYVKDGCTGQILLSTLHLSLTSTNIEKIYQSIYQSII